MSEASMRQHYVPKFYLRGFARGDQIGTVLLDGPRRFTQSVATAASEMNFHTVPGHPDGDNAFEDLLGKVEGGVAVILKKIANGTWPLAAEDRAELAEFLAIQAVRGAEYRRTMSFMLAQILRVTVGIGGKGKLRAEIEKILGPDAATDELVDSIWEQSVRPEGPTIWLTAFGHIRQIIDVSEAVRPFIENRPWFVYRFGEPGLITSDSPVALVPEGTGRPDSAIGYGTAKMIVYPIDRSMGLLMYNLVMPEQVDQVLAGRADFEEAGMSEHRRFFNLASTLGASEAIFHHPDDAPFVPDELPPPRPVTAHISGVPDSFLG